MTFSLAELPLPLRLVPQDPMSDEDLLRFCAMNELLRIEREPNGELLIMSPTASSTGQINFRLCRLLDEWAEADGRGVGFDSNAGFTLPDGSMRSPDAAWVELSRWKALTRAEQDRFAPLCPDFIVELLSPSDHLNTLHRKMQHWIDNGAKLAWLIDPIRRTVSIYRPQHEPEIHNDPTSIYADGIMSGFELILSRLWGK